jgi:hypothetical protein
MSLCSCRGPYLPTALCLDARAIARAVIFHEAVPASTATVEQPQVLIQITNNPQFYHAQQRTHPRSRTQRTSTMHPTLRLAAAAPLLRRAVIKQQTPGELSTGAMVC